MKLIIIFLFSLCLFVHPPVFAGCEGNPPSGANELEQYIKDCQNKVASLQGQQQTLKSAISAINTKINLIQGQISVTESQIKALEKDIQLLGTLLGQLDQSLDKLKTIFTARVRDLYKHRDIDSLQLFFSSKSFGDFLASWRFLNVVRARDQIVLTELGSARNNYDQQKQLKEQKQKQVETLKNQLVTQRVDLANQQADKQNLLKLTQNDEKKYQDLLAKAKAELAAIEALISGKGTETEVGDISSGQKIATIISGASACSTGTHLHFEVVKNQSHQNPSNFLKSIDNITWSNQPDGSFGFSGNWDWPINSPVRITQGYGNTAYSSRYAGHFHTGIDMVSENSEVKAVKDGKLYRGSISCGGGTLKYVHIKHKDDGYDTYYLHVNYF